MRVTNISHIQKSKYTTFSADFIFSHPYGGKRTKLHYWLRWCALLVTHPTQILKHRWSVRKRIWYTLPTGYISNESVTDAFFILALPIAVANQEDLEFDGQVSSELLKKSLRIQNYYHEVFKRPVKVKAQIKVDVKRKSEAVAQFFTLGVDSFYTLGCYSPSANSKPRTLVYVDGYDVPFFYKRFLNQVHKHISQTAKSSNTHHLFIETNLREVTDEILGWGRYHVTALVAVATFLNFRKMYISGESFDAVDWGLRSGVDALYSTKSTTISFVAHNVSRMKKIARILKSDFRPLFLKHVRVCWENVRQPQLPYNCSKCQKCIKTKLSLYVLGETNTPTLHFPSLDDLSALQLVGHVKDEWVELYQKIKRLKHADPQLLAAMRKVLDKPLRA